MDTTTPRKRDTLYAEVQSRIRDLQDAIQRLQAEETQVVDVSDAPSMKKACSKAGYEKAYVSYLVGGNPE